MDRLNRYRFLFRIYCYFYVRASFNYIVMRCYFIFILTLIYFVKDWRGKLIQRQAPREEIVTTGIQKRESYKYTENQIRREHGLPVRVSY